MMIFGLLGAIVVVLAVLVGLSVIPISGPVIGALFILVMLAGGVPYYGKWGAP